MSKTTGAIISIIVVALAGALFFLGRNFWASQFPAPETQQQQNVVALPAQTIGLPVHLSIPAIHVDANVKRVGLAKDGSVGVPDGPYDVAWFQQGPRPGEKGSSVITGHFGPWKTGAHSVFDNLDKLKAGDKIYVTDDAGKSYTFVVAKTKVYDPLAKAPEVFASSDLAHLNLITCHGDWLNNSKTYTQRWVVFADLV